VGSFGRCVEYLGADVRPEACHRWRRIQARYSHLTLAIGLAKLNIGGFSPGVHVQEQARAEVCGRAVQKLDREAHPGGRPAPPD